MMGLPAGWVTDVPDISRTQQLKMLGNGVVPQQAALAWSMLGLGGQMPELPEVELLLPTPNPFHSTNTEEPDEWRARRSDVFERTGTRHGPALAVVARSTLPGEVLLTPETYMGMTQ